MDEGVAYDLVAILAPLLRALEMLDFIGRHLHPPDVDALLKAIGTPDDALRSVVSKMQTWPEAQADLRSHLATASTAVLTAYDGLRTALNDGDDIRAMYRALRQIPRASSALYPLAANYSAISRFFLNFDQRGNSNLEARLSAARDNDFTGLNHNGDEPGRRGGYSLYVPEYYAPDHPLPLVMALHGGSGNGSSFMWSWLRDARSLGAIVVAPTAEGATWSLSGEDVDTPNLLRILASIQSRYNIDPSKLLLTGMSDGGTFCYLSGLEAGSPFTHIAPVAATFHPMLVQISDADRMSGLPIYIVHGCLDWMFPVELARHAKQVLTAVGGKVIYREIDDLSHCYPREVNSDLLVWLNDQG